MMIISELTESVQVSQAVLGITLAGTSWHGPRSTVTLRLTRRRRARTPAATVTVTVSDGHAVPVLPIPGRLAGGGDTVTVSDSP